MWLRRIFKSGDGLAIILPSAYCREHNVRRGDYIEARATAAGLIIQPYGLTAVSQGAEHVTRDSGKPPDHAPGA